MIWRFLLVLTLAAGFVAPASAQDSETASPVQQDIVVDCSLGYMESFATWEAYLAGGRQGDQPLQPLVDDPCRVERLQAQLDAFEADRNRSIPEPAPAIDAPPVEAPPIATSTPAPSSTSVPDDVGDREKCRELIANSAEVRAG